MTFGFALNFADVAAYRDLLESDVQITVDVKWRERVQTFAFSKELLVRYVELVQKYPNQNPCLMVNFTGLDVLPKGMAITVIPSVTAVGGKLQNTGAEMIYKV